MRDARAHGLLAGAYWYVRHPSEGTTFERQAAVVAAQLRAARDSLDDDPAVWLDAETDAHALSAADLADAAGALAAEGVRCAGVYTTRSYWRLRRFPRPGGGPGRVPGGLWLARWPGGAGYPGDDHPAWRPFRGRTPDLWQFTDRGQVAGFTVDVSAYRGDADGLRRLLAGRAVTPPPAGRPGSTADPGRRTP